ncbi:MAG: hypothetical protein ACI4S3_01285, partial [Candidatus Gastranaerophilaceae bacterium]
TIGKEIIAWTKAKSTLASRPVRVNPTKLKLAPQLEKDTVQLTGKKLTQIKSDTDEILKELKSNYNIEYIEKEFPNIAENVRLGKISNDGSTVYYHRYKLLETFSKENPEAFVLFGKEMGSALDMQIMLDNYGDVPIKLAKEMPIEEIKKAFAELDKFAQKMDFEPDFEHYMNMLIMKKYNPETYKYLMTTNDMAAASIVEQWGNVYSKEPPSTVMLKNITPEQIRVMVNNRLPGSKYIGAYVENSDAIVKYPKNIQGLSEDLSKVRLSSDVELYRGEKTVGMYDSIGIDKKLEQQIRQLLEQHKSDAINRNITEYTGRYNCGTSTNLYDYLSSKETLTLADAMQMAKYGDEKFINELATQIQNAKITDTRFKSFSFDEGMSKGWKNLNREDNTTILQRATIKQGTQGGFHDGNNGQYEVILNNTPKEISCNKVVYDRDSDTFVLDTIVQNV